MDQVDLVDIGLEAVLKEHTGLTRTTKASAVNKRWNYSFVEISLCFQSIWFAFSDRLHTRPISKGSRGAREDAVSGHECCAFQLLPWFT